MGLENRDYARRQDSYTPSPLGGLTIVGWIIAVSVAVFVLQCVWTRPGVGFEPDRVSQLDDWFSLDPWKVIKGQIWRLTTYDFLHDRTSIWHLVFNMYLLYLTGRKLLDVYSEKEFLLFYLLSGAASGLVFLGWAFLMGDPRPAIGASGAVCAVMVWYAMLWPNDRWTIFYVIPVTAMQLAVISAIMDIYPMLLELGGSRAGGGVAHAAHIGGMLFGYLYVKRKWILEDLLDRWQVSKLLERKPKLRVVRDDNESPRQQRDDARLRERLDELLEKISEHGQASLTDAERSELNDASRYFRDRR